MIDLLPLAIPLSIPSPGDGVWQLGPLPIRGYALCIILGIVAAIWIGERRWTARGGRPGDVQDLAIWAVPFGLVGARLYHVATDSERYFGEGNNPITALYVWRGGLGVWGAVALGALGVYIWSRRRGVRISAVMDALAPGVIVAQAIGRWGNWFNQELYGKPTDLPWGLEIDPENYPDGLSFPQGTTFHPTFLYECIWNLGVAGVLVWAERRFKLGFGRVFALYVMGYTIGRGLTEYIRIDTVQLDDVAGLRFNVWTSIVLFALALAYFVIVGRRHPGQPASVYLPGREPVAEDDDAATGAATGTDGTKDDAATEADPDDPDDPTDPDVRTNETAAPARAKSDPGSSRDDA